VSAAGAASKASKSLIQKGCGNAASELMPELDNPPESSVSGADFREPTARDRRSDEHYSGLLHLTCTDGSRTVRAAESQHGNVIGVVVCWVQWTR